MPWLKIKQLSKLFIDSLKDLQRNDPLRLAGATAFFCTFALPPILIIIIQLFGLVVDKKKLRKELFEAISQVVGKEGGRQVHTVFSGIKSLAVNWYIALGGFIFLLFVSTTLFKVIKDSINQLWEIHPRENKIKIQLYSRFRSLLVLVLAGILFFLGLFAEGVQGMMGHFVQDAGLGSFLLLINKGVLLLIFSTWFMLLFRYLPDAVTSWRIARVGGVLTGVLFTIGKGILKILLPYKNITSVFGAAGSFVLLLLFVFYCSLIFYYGACFTKAYATFAGDPIRPKHHATSYQLTDIKL